jgi:hypothetical protein
MSAKGDLKPGRVLIRPERVCVEAQPQRFQPAAADTARTAALPEYFKSGHNLSLSLE